MNAKQFQLLVSALSTDERAELFQVLLWDLSSLCDLAEDEQPLLQKLFFRLLPVRDFRKFMALLLASPDLLQYLQDTLQDIRHDE